MFHCQTIPVPVFASILDFIGLALLVMHTNDTNLGNMGLVVESVIGS
jgi:hypothetical protein